MGRYSTPHVWLGHSSNHLQVWAQVYRSYADGALRDDSWRLQPLDQLPIHDADTGANRESNSCSIGATHRVAAVQCAEYAAADVHTNVGPAYHSAVDVPDGGLPRGSRPRDLREF